ncbi:ATP-binding protein [uncultured Desulfobacter sp.]|uniref:hybrid sensor histidine kinase/response regulator n=1 Tax=uncultured Desulfobacter sp. TaxID=240139 RepID=UPI0029F52F85|nr:ATP-binding protein [uncultured Desulfobacter sp.]
MEENKRILVIDDDETIRETYQSILLPEDEPDSLSMGRALFDMPMDDDDTFSDSLHPAAASSDGHNIPLTGHFDSKNPDAYELALADRGIQGIELVENALHEKNPFSVAFIDMKMPGLNGAETAGKIWTLDPRIKIVIVTAYSEYSPEDIIAVTGRDDLFYLRKPFNHEEILQFARALTHTWGLEQKKIALQSELEQSNRALAEANRGLENKVRAQASMIVQADKMASIGLLAAGVAHEINNPLAYVRSNLDTSKKYFTRIVSLIKKYEALESYLASSTDQTTAQLLDDLTDEKKEKDLDFIVEDLDDLITESLHGVNRIREIVQDLRTFSRVDDAKQNDLYLNEALDNTLKILKTQIKQDTMVIKSFGDIPPIQCYPQKISQVLMNVLINAIQAIEGSGTIELSTRFVRTGRRVEDRFVEIVVSDTGCGIPQENIKKLFDPFFTTKPVGTGTGLGLSIVYEIITFHGGSIDVTSELGHGSRFRILLPEKMRDIALKAGPN